jgi:riboflavin kinase/FMN adenylyltransferase
VASIGTRPTVSDAGKISTEAHLFDFDEDIYGQYVRIAFVARLRDELKFDSMEALKEALHGDARAAREMLGLG